MNPITQVKIYLLFQIIVGLISIGIYLSEGSGIAGVITLLLIIWAAYLGCII